MKKIVKPHKARKPSASTGLAQYKGGKDDKPLKLTVLYYDSSTGEYSSDLSPKLTVLNRIGDDPTQWTYTDDEGRLYTPINISRDSGEIKQGKDPSAMDRFLSWSNRHYNDPILGAAARYANTVKNNLDPITGVASFMPGIGETIDVLSAASDFLSGNYKQAAIGGALSLLPFVPYSKVRNLVNSFGSNVIVPAMMRFSGNNQNRISDTAQMFANDRFRNDILNLSGDNYYRSHNGTFKNNGTSKRFISYGGVYPGFEGYGDWHLSGRIKTPGKHVYEIPKDAIGDLPAVNDSGQRASGMIGDYNNPFGNQAVIHDIKLSEAIKNSPHTEYVQTPAGTQRILHLGKPQRNRNDVDNTSTIYYKDVTPQVRQRIDDELYRSYLNDPQTKRDMLLRMELEDAGFFGPDYRGYINDYQNDINNLRAFNTRYQDIVSLNSPNNDPEHITNLIDDLMHLQYPSYPARPFYNSNEIMGVRTNARNQYENTVSPSMYEMYNRLSGLRDLAEDNRSLEHVNNLIERYERLRNPEDGPYGNVINHQIFISRGTNPELEDRIQLLNNIERNIRLSNIRSELSDRLPEPPGTIDISYAVGRPATHDPEYGDEFVRSPYTSEKQYDPNDLPTGFNNSEIYINDKHGAYYYYLSPREAVEKANEDFKKLKHGQAWALASDGATSTDSYPLMLIMMNRHKKDGSIIPIRNENGSLEFMRLNSSGRLKGQPAVDRINDKIKKISEIIGEDLPGATVKNNSIYVPKIIFRKYDGGKDKKGLVQRTVEYNTWRLNLPKNLLKETPDYDLYGAFKAGLQPEWNDKDKSYHLGSRDPKAGKILKKPSHPTFGLAIYNDMLLGYYPIYKDGEIYTVNQFEYNSGKDSGIHIKKANRGKFTAAAKRAGMGVQAYARKILNAPKGKYSSTLRKRANFARNFAH